MKILSTEEVQSWCHARGLTIGDRGKVSFDPPSPHRFSVSLADKPARVIGLAESLVSTWDEDIFQGALFWVRERWIWDDHTESVGELIVQQMRRADGEVEPLEKLPGHLFGPEEAIKMHAYFAIPLLFGWDAYLILENRDCFLCL